MDQITVVRIDDTHIAEERCHDGGKVQDVATAAVCYEAECAAPTAEEEVGEEEEDSVFVIEYSNPEEEGESYQFTMSLDRSLSAKRPAFTRPAAPGSAGAASPVASKPARPKPRLGVKQKRKLKEKESEQEAMVSNKSLLELGENYSDVMEMNLAAGKTLFCRLCPPPGRHFKRPSGLAVHIKQMHLMEDRKTFYCSSCDQKLRTQVELDGHTKRHATQEAVFTCSLCAAQTDGKAAGFKGSKWGLKRHMEKEHPGVVPRCHICARGFKTLMTYLADQFRHIGVTPYYCPKCQIYEMTERGLSVHMKNHEKRRKKQETQESGEGLVSAVPSGTDNSATDDSDF